MPAFGSTDAFKEAAGFPRELGAWDFDQYKRWLDEGNTSKDYANWIRDRVVQATLEALDNGLPVPEEVRRVAEQVMPGYEDMLARRGNNLDAIRQGFEQLAPGSTTADRIDTRLNDQAGDIVRTGELTQRRADDLRGRQLEREDRTSGQVSGDIISRGSGMERGVNDTFGSLRAGNARMGSDILSSLNNAYGDLRESRDANTRRTSDLSRATTDELAGSADRAFNEIGGLRTRTYNAARDDSDSTFGGIEDLSRDSTGRLLDDLGTTYGGLREDVGDTFGDLEGSLEDTYGTLGTRTGEVYGDLGTGAEEAYGTSLEETEMLRPAGEAQTAQVARSFAPAVANLKQRLRTGGVDPNSLQGISAQAELESARARAMDDAAAGSTAGYVDRRANIRQAEQDAAERRGTRQLDTEIGLGERRQSGRENLAVGRVDRTTGLTEREREGRERMETTLRDTMERLGLGALANRQELNLAELTDTERNLLDRELMQQGLRLGDVERQIAISDRGQEGQERLTIGEQDRGRDILEGQLERDIDLGVGQSDRVTSINARTGEDWRGEQLRRLNAEQGSDILHSEDTQRNLDTQFERTSDWRNAGTQNDLLRRAMEREDWQTASDLLRERNGEELTAQDVRNLAYDRGMDWVLNDATRRDTAAGNLNQIGRDQYSREANAANTALRFGEQARGAYGQTYEQEAGKGGWAGRLIGGALGAAAPFLAAVPGVGPFLSAGATVASGALAPKGGAAGQTGLPTGGYGSGQSQNNPYIFSWQQPAYQVNAARNAQSTQAGYNRAQISPGRVAPGQSQYPWQNYGY